MGNQTWPPLASYVRWLPQVRALGLSEEDLQAVPVHPEPPSGVEFISLGEIPPGAPPVGQQYLPPTGTRQLYALRSEVPERVWEQLTVGLLSGRPSGSGGTGMFGNSEERVVDEENPRESWRRLDEGRRPFLG